jgi:hypothetical protein
MKWKRRKKETENEKVLNRKRKSLKIWITVLLLYSEK